MAALLVAIAIMMVLLGVAMPAWNHQARREREEELLFRLKQYAHAIALYQRRVPGASPPSIDLLVEQRYLRRKYTDPVTGKDFALLRVGQVSPGMTTPLPGGTAPRRGGDDDEAPGPGPGGRGNTGGRAATPPSTTSSPNQPGAGAIRGVVSTSTESSLRQWKGRTRYDEWEVTPEDIVPRFGPTIADPTQQGPGSGTGRPSAAPGGSGARGPFGVRPGGGMSQRPPG